jgi:glycosyltransferase involved in cell wall biosynthesis
MAHQWIVSQIGSRQHYAVPRGFAAIGGFKQLYTDAWCPTFMRQVLLHGNSAMRAFAGRWHAEIPARQVVSHNIRSIMAGLHRLEQGDRSIEQQYMEYLRAGREFDDLICHRLSKPGAVDPKTDAFFGFNSTSLSTIRAMRERGVPTVLDQIDPAKVEEDIVFAEGLKWPGWQQTPGRVPEEYWDRLSAEWNAADLVLVNSQWTRSALVKQGLAPEKIIIVPLAYEPAPGPVPLPRRDDHPLTILWLGAVILRKGIQYLIEAARLLGDRNMKFVVVGPIGISQMAMDTAPPNMSFLGRITREQTHELYQSADLFVLPTLSDGFAITQVEAMNRGLPVIATPNCGEVVTHGQNGLIVPAADGRALAEAISQLDQDRGLLAEMSHNAFIRSTQFLLPNQARAVETAVQEMKTWGGIKLARPARVAVVQDGARLHYAVPVALHRNGSLEAMFSEWFLKNRLVYRVFGSLVRLLNQPTLRGLVERTCDEIPASKVHINLAVLLQQIRVRDRRLTSEAYYKWSAETVGAWIARQGMGRVNVLFGFIRNIDPKLCKRCQEMGMLTVGDQMIAPSTVEAEEYQAQSERWPGWEPPSNRPDFELMNDMEQQSWAALDRVTCASDYVRDGLLRQGVAAEKVSVIHYPIDTGHFPEIRREVRPGPVRVGFIGAVGLRKGAPYFLEVAKRLGSPNLKFEMIGPLLLSPEGAARFSPHVELVGRVARSRIPEYLRQFDIYLFPSTCEGSAGSVMEAMAYGMPVVTSPNSGSVVRDGVDGMIRAYDDVDGLAACVQKLVNDPALRIEMGRAGRERVESINIGAYGRQLVKVIEWGLASKNGT